MEIAIGIISITLTFAGIYIAYLQLRRTSPEPQAPSKEILPIVQNAQRDLDSSESQIRKDAISTLATTNHPSALDALIEASQHPTLDVRIASIMALQSFSGTEVYQAFETAMFDSNAKVRIQAIKALQSFSDAEVYHVFEKAMSDSDAQVRVNAVKGLSHSPLPSSINTLLNALYDKNAEVVETTLRTLLFTPTYNKNSIIIHPLTICWKDVYYPLDPHSKKVQYLREECEKVLASFGEQAIDPIIQVIDETKQLEKINYKVAVHMVASKALSLICSPKAVQAYLYFIDESNYVNCSEFEKIRGDSALALAKLGDQRAGLALIKARSNYWTDSKGFCLVPNDGYYNDKFTLALRELNYPFNEDPHKHY